MGHLPEYWREYRDFREAQAAAGGSCFREPASGAVGGNAISNVTDDDPGQTSCGVFGDAVADTVIVGGNDFPDPPGNE